jgi:hypothetical protein
MEGWPSEYKSGGVTQWPVSPKLGMALRAIAADENGLCEDGGELDEFSRCERDRDLSRRV